MPFALVFISVNKKALLQSQKDFISAVDSEANQIASVKTIKGGKSGTYAVELVAMEYAALIDPAYEVRVNGSTI